MQRAISCTFSTLVVGLLWPVFKGLQCEKKPSPSIVHDQHCNPMMAVFMATMGVKGCNYCIMLSAVFEVLESFLKLCNSSTLQKLDL